MDVKFIEWKKSLFPYQLINIILRKNVLHLNLICNFKECNLKIVFVFNMSLISVLYHIKWYNDF